jgi:hypothetical protein
LPALLFLPRAFAFIPWREIKCLNFVERLSGIKKTKFYKKIAINACFLGLLPKFQKNSY